MPHFESGGWTVEIYADPDSDGGMEYLGRLDLFSNVLYVERPYGPLTFDIPPTLIGNRPAVEKWVATKL